MVIKTYSPQLCGALSRLKDAAELDTLDWYFKIAIENSGLSELDYERDPEMSFNPRPARIALNLMQTVDVSETMTLCVGMLSTVWQQLGERLVAEIPDDVAALTREAVLPPPAQAAGEQHAASSVNFVRLALFLDRARHLHLASSERRVEVLTQCSPYIELARELSPPVHMLLLHWHRRTEKQMHNSIICSRP
jgi:hypothetical protein